MASPEPNQAKFEAEQNQAKVDRYQRGILASAGISALNLTPQEQFLYQHHVDNFRGPGTVLNPDGSRSTVRQMTVEGPGGRIYNLPTVWDGRILSFHDAIARAAQIGWDKWPSYGSEQEAQARYDAMHEFIAKDEP